MPRGRPRKDGTTRPAKARRHPRYPGDRGGGSKPKLPQITALLEFNSHIKREGDCVVWTGYSRTDPEPKYWTNLGPGGRPEADRHHPQNFRREVGLLIYNGKVRRAHRFAYAVYQRQDPGTFPPRGIHITQTCSNSLCVSREHLQPKRALDEFGAAPGYVPNRLKTMCKRGHYYDEENTYWTAKGTRICKRCQKEVHYPALKARRLGQLADQGVWLEDLT